MARHVSTAALCGVQMHGHSSVAVLGAWIDATYDFRATCDSTSGTQKSGIDSSSDFQPVGLAVFACEWIMHCATFVSPSSMMATR